MRRVFILFVVLIGVGGSLAYVYGPSVEHRIKTINITKEQETRDLQLTKDLLNQSKPEEAFAIIAKYSNAVDNQTEIGKEWLELLIRASEATSNVPQLAILYDYYPRAFDSHEKASLLLAELYLNQGRSQEFQTIRDVWRGRETQPETWFALDVDKLILDGQRKEASEMLSSRSFSGKADTPRLIRLALLNIFDNPKSAWEYLTAAYNKDPQNPMIRSYRGKLLETVGKNNLALYEYLGAIQTDPKNLYLKDQLAEFYLRNKQYPYALQIWVDNLKPPSLDLFWIKAYFWGRVAKPIKLDWALIPPPEGKAKPFIEYLLALKPGQFWDHEAFEKLDNSGEYLKTQQVTYWLRLIEALKQNNEKEASDLLTYNPFHATSWSPQLEDALRKILIFRQTGKFGPTLEKKEEQAPKKIALPTNMPALFSQIEYLAQNPVDEKKGEQIPADLQELLMGPDAFAAAFLAAGWNEAALELNALSIIPKGYPEWVAYQFTQALSQNRSIPAAIEFATLQNPTPQLSLLIGELLLANGSPEAALENLGKLAKEDTEVGMRAAWLMSLIYVDKAQYTEAKETIQNQPKLTSSVLGQETLARIAVLEGNNELADKIYNSIETISAEAKSYLARRAFQAKDWKKARELTEELMKEYPANQLLQENLQKIIEEENKAKATQ